MPAVVKGSFVVWVSNTRVLFSRNPKVALRNYAAILKTELVYSFFNYSI